MKKNKFILVALFLASCTITRDVEPVSKTALPTKKEICVLENTKTRKNVKNSLVSALQNKGYKVNVVDQNDLSGCPVYISYTAKWTWDLAVYMSYLDINVFKDSEKIGSASYDSRGGSGRLIDKFINADRIVSELVDDLI